MSVQASPRECGKSKSHIFELLAQNKYTEAKFFLEKALSNPSASIFSKINQLNNLGCVYYNLNQEEEAGKRISQSLEYKNKLTPLQLIGVLINSASILSNNSEHESAHKQLLKVLHKLQKHKDEDEIRAVVLFNLSIELLHLNKNQVFCNLKCFFLQI